MAISRPTVKAVVKPQKQKQHKDSISWTTGESVIQNKLNISQKDFLKEKLNRLSSTPNKIQDLVTIIDNSSSMFELYNKYHKAFDSDDDLIALNVLSQEDVHLFRYMIEHNLNESVSATKIKPSNQSTIFEGTKKFQQFMVNNPQYSKISSIDESSTLKLPNIYILGKKNDYELINAMSLNTRITLVNTINSLDVFERDNGNKVVLIFPEPNTQLSEKYNDIFDRQNFKTYRCFQIGSTVDEQNEIVPLNRKKLILKII